MAEQVAISETILRPAREQDLARAYDIMYVNDIAGDPNPPPAGDVPSYLPHVLRTGTIYVAERDGAVIAFAGAITRGNVTFLTDLFVYPDRQSAGLGRALLTRVMPPGAHIRCTFSSTDPRALALYIRSGMQPQWPHFCLELTETIRGDLPTGDVEIVEAPADDPELVRWDARIGGRPRPGDHDLWVREQRGRPLWFRRGVDTVGYAYVRLGDVTPWHPDACKIGPVGAAAPGAAAACVMAAVDWARRHAQVLMIDVPGLHPALAPLLEARFRIAYVETFLSTAATPFFDARCYVASGSSLL